jgi:hypothetical protein
MSRLGAKVYSAFPERRCGNCRHWVRTSPTGLDRYAYCSFPHTPSSLGRLSKPNAILPLLTHRNYGRDCKEWECLRPSDSPPILAGE